MDEFKSEGREKYWSELNDSEKIERMRKVVKQNKDSLDYIRNQLWDLREHFHAEGQTVVPLSYNERPRETTPLRLGKNKDDIYF